MSDGRVVAKIGRVIKAVQSGNGGEYTFAGVRRLTSALWHAAPWSRAWWLRWNLRLYQFLYRYINFLAGEYYGRSPKYEFDWGIDRIISARIPPGAVVLDIGCGSGELARRISRSARRVYGYDIDDRAVAIAAKNAPPNVRVFQGEAASALPNGRFDAVILSSILPFVDEPEELLRAVASRTDLLIVRETRHDRDFTVPLMTSLGLRHRTDPSVRREYTQATLLATLERSGWTVVEYIDTYDIFVVARPISAAQASAQGPAPTVAGGSRTR